MIPNSKKSFSDRYYKEQRENQGVEETTGGL